MMIEKMLVGSAAMLSYALVAVTGVRAVAELVFMAKLWAQSIRAASAL